VHNLGDYNKGFVVRPGDDPRYEKFAIPRDVYPGDWFPPYHIGLMYILSKVFIMDIIKRE
jgi:hypothetical protein